MATSAKDNMPTKCSETGGRKFFVGGNWKMNGSKTLIAEINKNLWELSECEGKVEIVCAPPALYLQEFIQTKPKFVQASGQNCYFKESGAFTGEISAKMFEELNCEWVILGHSERRTIFFMKMMRYFRKKKN